MEQSTTEMVPTTASISSSSTTNPGGSTSTTPSTSSSTSMPQNHINSICAEGESSITTTPPPILAPSHHPNGQHPSTSNTAATTTTSTTNATWTSAFDSVCWISPLYFCIGRASRQQQQPQPTKERLPSYSKFLYHHHPENKQGGALSQATQAEQRRAHTASSPSLMSASFASTTCPLQMQKEKEEVLGWTLDAAARGVCVMGTAVFVSSELLIRARQAAGCEAQGECENRIYGMRPSSILTNIILVVGLCSAVIMPLIGSVIDHTDCRRAVGAVSAVALVFFMLVQQVIIHHYWFIAAILQVFVAFSYTIHLCATYAYLPELTDNHETLVKYTAQFAAVQYCGSVTFLLAMVVILSLINRNDRFSSVTISQTVVCTVASLFMGYAWSSLLRTRPATQTVPPNRSLLSAGFWKIYQTAQTILSKHAAIKWFLVAAAFIESATTTFSTIAITYMTDYLGFSARENGIAILLLLISGVPGTRLAAFLTNRINPIRSLQLCLILWVANTTAASLLLKSPDQQNLAYGFAVVWGLAIGWVYPTEKALYVTIIPRGQEAELMGTYICCCQIISWLPPMLFTIMNEMGVSMRVGLFSLTIYFVIGFGVLFLVGDYNEAVSHAKAVDNNEISGYAMPTTDGLGIDGYGCYQEFAEEDIEEMGCLPIALAD